MTEAKDRYPELEGWQERFPLPQSLESEEFWAWTRDLRRTAWRSLVGEMLLWALDKPDISLPIIRKLHAAMGSPVYHLDTVDILLTSNKLFPNEPQILEYRPRLRDNSTT